MYQRARDRTSGLLAKVDELGAYFTSIEAVNSHPETEKPGVKFLLNSVRPQLKTLEDEVGKGEGESDKWALIWRQVRTNKRRDELESLVSEVKGHLIMCADVQYVQFALEVNAREMAMLMWC